MTEHAIKTDQKSSGAVLVCIKMETPTVPDFSTYNFIVVTFILSVLNQILVEYKARADSFPYCGASQSLSNHPHHSLMLCSSEQ